MDGMIGRYLSKHYLVTPLIQELEFQGARRADLYIRLRCLELGVDINSIPILESDNKPSRSKFKESFENLKGVLEEIYNSRGGYTIEAFRLTLLKNYSQKPENLDRAMRCMRITQRETTTIRIFLEALENTSPLNIREKVRPENYEQLVNNYLNALEKDIIEAETKKNVEQ